MLACMGPRSSGTMLNNSAALTPTLTPTPPTRAPRRPRSMVRLVSFTAGADAAPRVGVLIPLGAAEYAHTHVVDLVAAFAADGGPPLTGGMRTLLSSLDSSSGIRVRTAAQDGRWRTALADTRLHAPITDPEKIICGARHQFPMLACHRARALTEANRSRIAVGMNYHDHCAEIGVAVPKEPVLFGKFASSITGPGCPIPLDEDLTSELDFEVELCIVVGKGGRRIPKERALEHIAGWTVAHDVSARDLQLKRNGGQWLLGKTGDGYSPIGPCIVTRDEGPEFRDAGSLGLRTFLNGDVMQNSNTSQLVFKPADVIEWASRYFSLTAGDLIFTGTPGGVGVFRKPPLHLKDGDEVVVEIDGLGRLHNTVRSAAKLAGLQPSSGAQLSGGVPGPSKRARL